MDSINKPVYCSICLETVTALQKCYCYMCMHQYCYACLKKWTKRKTVCPLCKSEIKAIIYDIKSDEVYSVQILKGKLFNEFDLNYPKHNYLDDEEYIQLRAKLPKIKHYSRVNQEFLNERSAFRHLPYSLRAELEIIREAVQKQPIMEEYFRIKAQLISYRNNKMENYRINTENNVN